MLVSDIGAQALLCNILHTPLRSHLLMSKAKSQMKAKEVSLLCSHWEEMTSHFVPWTPIEGKGDGMKKLTRWAIHFPKEFLSKDASLGSTPSEALLVRLTRVFLHLKRNTVLPLILH